MTALLDFGLHALQSAYRAGTLDVGQVIEEVLKRIAAAGDDTVWITRTPDEPVGDLGKLSVFAGVRQFPVRVKCASLAWHTLRAAADARNEVVSTE